MLARGETIARGPADPLAQASGTPSFRRWSSPAPIPPCADRSRHDRGHGIESLSYQVAGTVRLTDDGLELTWTETETSQRVSLERLGTDVGDLGEESLDLTNAQLAGAWVVGGWWRPRLELRVQHTDDLDHMPAARGVTVMLRIERRDRALAAAIAAEIRKRTGA